MNTDRFSSREELPWAKGAYDDGFQARCLNCGIDQVPNADVIGEYCHRSWIAGWADADMDFLSKEEGEARIK